MGIRAAGVVVDTEQAPPLCCPSLTEPFAPLVPGKHQHRDDDEANPGSQWELRHDDEVRGEAQPGDRGYERARVRVWHKEMHRAQEGGQGDEEEHPEGADEPPRCLAAKSGAEDDTEDDRE
mmetsp:Transcript_6605/g.8170  ORF Transcript_6605/g.8170 Transcript_6605/m.8170 type:complete len:121 (-) Transcript_6605:421-783(-)